MPRVIFKCPYIRGGTSKAASHLNHYVRYAATREGAQRIVPSSAQLPATEKQRDMVERLLRDFPLSRGMFEYEDYLASPTRGNASEFITRSLEDNYDQIAKKGNYVSYIASRPRAQRAGDHALFTASDDPLVLSQIADEVAHHPGNVWLPIISLRREDAARLGYDDARQWRELLTGYAMEMAEAMKIPWEQFRWYAAFHDEAHHPHVHMVCYSVDGMSGFLTKDGIAQIKAGLAKEIFQQELHEIYVRQTQRRDTLTQEAGAVMAELIWQMQTGSLDDPRIERLMANLAGRLRDLPGKKQYGYLKAPLKAVVDEIVDELAKDSRVAAAYDLWYELREEVLRTYRDDLPERLPLSQQKEFKRIKNLVIEEALQLAGQTAIFDPADFDDVPDSLDRSGERSEGTDQGQAESAAGPDDPHAQYTLGKTYRDGRGVEKDALQAAAWFHKSAEQGHGFASYALGTLLLDGGDGLSRDIPAAVKWLRCSAEAGNPFAQYRLGKLLLQGGDVPRDAAEAVRLLTSSAEQGNQYAQYALGKLYLPGKEVPEDHDAAVRWFTLSAAQGNESAQHFLDHINDFHGPSVFTCATRLLRHMGRIFQEQAPRAPVKALSFTDKKLRRRIQEKKMAIGHKADDHEDVGINMQ
nr:MobP3 family relaxase [uncultured Oscillibacter sp.]